MVIWDKPAAVCVIAVVSASRCEVRAFAQLIQESLIVDCKPTRRLNGDEAEPLSVVVPAATSRPQQKQSGYG